MHSDIEPIQYACAFWFQYKYATPAAVEIGGKRHRRSFCQGWWTTEQESWHIYTWKGQDVDPGT